MSYSLRVIPTISLLFVQLTSMFGGVRLVEGAARFTEIPPSLIYVSEGGNARFTWDYHVDDRDAEFNVYSPKWRFYENATVSKATDIAFDNQGRSWAWETAKTCPPRLLNPTRVSKESNATLVIVNVTTADSGIYGCSLVFQLSQTITEKSQLIVTVRPLITITGKRSVLENTSMTLNCSAVGPPTPNVTWINNEDVVLEQGIQSAILTITNITREKNGTIYKCNATNNPNEDPVQEEIVVTVKFPPEVNRNKSTNSVKDCFNKKVEIICAAYGYPDPTYYWYNPLNVSVGENKTGESSMIQVDPVPGNWTCHITNGVGQDIDYPVQMIVLHDANCTTSPSEEKKFSTGEIAGFVIGFFIAIVIIVAIVVLIYKKNKEKEDLTTRDKACIGIGLLVSVVIIIVIIVVIITKI